MADELRSFANAIGIKVLAKDLSSPANVWNPLGLAKEGNG